MDRFSLSHGTTARLAARLRDIITRQAAIHAALNDIWREQDDLAQRALSRRHHGDRPID